MNNIEIVQVLYTTMSTEACRRGKANNDQEINKALITALSLVIRATGLDTELIRCDGNK